MGSLPTAPAANLAAPLDSPYALAAPGALSGLATSGTLSALVATGALSTLAASGALDAVAGPAAGQVRPWNKNTKP